MIFIFLHSMNVYHLLCNSFHIFNTSCPDVFNLASTIGLSILLQYLLNGSFAISGRIEKSRGYLLSFAEVMCELDITPTVTEISRPGLKGIAAGGLFIDVANSAQNFSSDQSLYVVYDSKCLNCSINGTCFRKVCKEIFCSNWQSIVISTCMLCTSLLSPWLHNCCHLAPVYIWIYIGQASNHILKNAMVFHQHPSTLTTQQLVQLWKISIIVKRSSLSQLSINIPQNSFVRFIHKSMIVIVLGRYVFDRRILFQP